MTHLGLNSKAIVISVVIHGMMAAGFMVTHPFGEPDRPEFEIITVGISAPAQKQVKQAPPPPPPPKKEEEKPKPKTQKPKPPAKEKTQPSDVKTEKAPPKEEPAEEPEYNETPSYAEGGPTESSSSGEDFSHAEFSGSFDSPGFEYPDWNYRGFEKIARTWNNRAFSTRPLFCKVHFFVLKSGRVHSVKIEEPSGNPVYDRGCKQAVERAAPLPPLPRNFAHEEVGISLVFPYKP